MLFANGIVMNSWFFLIELFAGILMHDHRIHLLNQSVTLGFFYLRKFFTFVYDFKSLLHATATQ